MIEKGKKMNKYQEELQNFQWNCQVESIHLKELVERATPVKLTSEIALGKKQYVCPKCFHECAKYDSYCWNCGQAFMEQQLGK